MSYLVHARIDAARLNSEVCAPHLGGATTFIGSVRRSPEDGPVEAIEYTAYQEMADREFDRIIAEVSDRWPDARVALQHRVGHVPTGEASMAVVAASPHRSDAFAACRYVVEEAKKRVPIWKKEIMAGGTARWRGNSTEQSG